LREQAWARLARDLDPKLLESMTTEIGLEEAIGAAQKLMAGQVRGRIVVRTGGEADGGVPCGQSTLRDTQ